MVDAFCALQPENLADQSLEKLDTICEHYSNSPLELNAVALKEEWREFVEFASSHSAMKKAKSLQDLAKEIVSRKPVQELFPLVTMLYSRAVAFPVSTADCERAFSAMNRIKTDLRGRLKTTTLEKLMFISLEGPDRMDFDYAAATDKWAKLRNRRIFSS